MITYGPAQNYDLPQILILQFENLKINLTDQEIAQQGFVTVKHDLDLLREMNDAYPHIVAKSEGRVVGYAFVMLKSIAHKVPILGNLFAKINQVNFRGLPLKQSSFFVMGQICIEKGYRGKDIFSGLYQTMKGQMQDHFQYIITEVAAKNTRSIRAHEKVGFESILKYPSEKGEDWVVILWDWK
jgi:L-amino acid N-acyltransferase YncA